jgi:hypothetical protein
MVGATKISWTPRSFNNTGGIGGSGGPGAYGGAGGTGQGPDFSGVMHVNKLYGASRQVCQGLLYLSSC